MANKLILRSKNSPFSGVFSDINKGSVLSHSELDNNFIYLKGNLIYTGDTTGTTLTLYKIDGTDITIDLSNLISAGDTYITGVTIQTGISSNTLVLTRNDNVNITTPLSPEIYVTGFTVNENTYSISDNSGNTFNAIWTGNSSTSCINDFYVSNIHSCSPLYINPLDEGNIYFGASSGVSVTILSGESRLGVNVSAPNYPFHTSGHVLVTNGSVGIGESPDSTHKLRVTTNDPDGDNMTGARVDLSHQTSKGTFQGLQVRSTTPKSGPYSLVFGVNSNLTGTVTSGSHTFVAGRFKAGTTESGGNADNYALQLEDGSEGTVGHVWTQVSPDGKGHWGAVTSSGISTDTYVSGATFDGIDTIYFHRNDTMSAFTVDLSTLDVNDTFISGMSFNQTNYDLTIHRNDGVDFTQSLWILASDVNVTGGTYDISTGVVTFTTNSGTSFQVTGFTSGMTDSYTTTAYTVNNSIVFDNNIQGPNFYDVDLTPVLTANTPFRFNALSNNGIEPRLGLNNTLTIYSNIGGGRNNNIIGSGTYNNINGGYNNTINNTSNYNRSNVIGGGSQNTISGDSSYNVIGGGKNNTINNLSNFSFIGGGSHNNNYGNGSVIVGGNSNIIPQYNAYSLIGGGSNNYCGGYMASILNGIDNTNLGNYTAIINGYSNRIENGVTNSAIIGCSNLTVTASNMTYMCSLNVNGSITIGGQPLIFSPFEYTSFNNRSIKPIKGNNLVNSSQYTTIGGGSGNTVSGNYNFLGGGYGNQINGYMFTTIVGGKKNNVTNSYFSIIGGGSYNYINADGKSYNGIFGGKNNEVVSSFNTVIGGGSGNTININSDFSTIIGGKDNTISHSNSHIIGSNIISVSADTTHVERLNINNTQSGSTSNELLVKESNGMVNTRSVTSITGGLSGKFATDFNFTGGTASTITHNLGTVDIIIQMKDSTGQLIIPNIVYNYTNNSVDIQVSTTDTYRVIIIG